MLNAACHGRESGTFGKTSRVRGGNAFLSPMFTNFDSTLISTHFAMLLHNGYTYVDSWSLKDSYGVRSAVFVPRRILAFSITGTSVVSNAVHGAMTAMCRRWDSDPRRFRFRFVQSDFGFLIVIEGLVQQDCTEFSVVLHGWGAGLHSDLPAYRVFFFF